MLDARALDIPGLLPVSVVLSNQKRNWGGFDRIIVTSVMNNYVSSFSSFLNKVKVKMNGFWKLHTPDGGHVGCGIWQRLAPQNDNYLNS